MKKTNKLAFNTFLFASPFTDASLPLLKKMREFGADGVEFALENKGDLNYAKTLAALKENNLQCSSICGAFGPGRDLRGTPEEQKGSALYIKDCIDAAKALGADVVVGPFYSRVGRAGAEKKEDKAEQWKLVTGHMRELCKYAADKGVYLGVEPLNRFETDFMNTVSDAVRLCHDVGHDHLMVHIDVFHANIEERNLPLAVVEAGKLLLHIHAADNYRGAPGTGSLDWLGLRDALRFIGYERYVVLETFTPDVEIIAKAAAIWRDFEESNMILAQKGMRFLDTIFR